MTIHVDIPFFLWLIFILFGYGACFAGIRRLLSKPRSVRP